MTHGFDEFFGLHFDAIYRYLARRLGDDVASDLASETFVRALAGFGRFDPHRGESRAWLFGIATNLLRRHYRDEERRLHALARLAQPLATPPEPDARVAAALAALADEERDVLLLYAWADLSYEGIAAALEVPVGTVRSRLHRARTRLREALEPQEALDG